ncbi:energy transducer TonB [Fluviicola sp.]|uniref:energy transducer TonB n=1 Tax=Fluviicola sp. TaxID=1917219 RepID=UPI003D295E9B
MKLKNGLLTFALLLVSGVAFSQEPPEPKPAPKPPQTETYKIVEEEAQFPGGRAPMMKFMAENLRYPQTAVEQDIQGKCYLEFIVMETGELTDIKVRRGMPDCPECDKEAIRLVKLMPKWIPAKNSGKLVKSVFVLPVTFKLN